MGSDVFSRKCGAHNIIVPQHRSCPVCVSVKRSQLHAANLAHMPRYLFEQTLEVKADETGLPKPVRSFMKNPLKEVPLTADKPCEVSWKVNFKSNYLAQSYGQLYSTTQALLMALDVTTDAKILKIRQNYQEEIDAYATATDYNASRLVENLAIDMYHEIVRVSKGRIEDPERVTGQFVAHFKLLYGNGQRLVRNEASAATTSKYVLNFPSVNTDIHLNATTNGLLRKLDKYEGDLGKLRVKHEAYIASLMGADSIRHAVTHMAMVLWENLPMAGEARALTKVYEQFLRTVVECYAKGQRLTEITQSVSVTVPASKQVRLPTYKLTRRSRDWHGHYELLQETQEVFRILEFGIPEVYQKWYSLCECVARGTTTVESMAYTMWDIVVKQHEVSDLRRDLMVRQDFVARFKYLYEVGVGQRIVIEETKQVSADASLVDCLYNYLTTSSKELYHKQSLLESELSKQLNNTREGLRARFRSLAHDTAEAYTADRMYDYTRIDAGTVRDLQDRLAVEFLAWKRR